MRTKIVRYSNDGPVGQPRGRHPLAKALVIIGVLLCVNWLLTFALTPTTEHDVWKRYRAHANDPLDSIVVGSSFSIQSFDATAIDAQLGSNTFSISWLGASLRSDYLGLETAIKEHEVTRAYIGIGPETLTDESTADIVKSNVQYVSWKMEGESLLEQASDFAYLLSDNTAQSDAKSFAAIFPWSIYYVDRTPSAIIENIKKKIGYATGSLQEEPFDYASSTGIGHIYTGEYDVDTMSAPYATSPSSKNDLVPVQANLDELAHICDLCAANGVELYVVVTPRPTYEVFHLGDSYAQLMGLCKSLVEEHGATYVDANALRPTVYQAAQSEFADAQHLNEKGSERFSLQLAALVRSLESGADLSQDFYSYDAWDEYLQSVSGLVLTGFNGTVEPGGIAIDAFSYAGFGTDVEYQVLAAFEGDEEGTREIQAYGTTDSLWVPTEGHGYVTFRVNARTVGSASDYERYCVKTFQY